MFLNKKWFSQCCIDASVQQKSKWPNGLVFIGAYSKKFGCLDIALEFHLDQILFLAPGVCI